MNWYKYSVNIKVGLFIVGILLVSAFVLFTQKIVRDLRDDNREIVQLYAEIIAGVATSENDESLNFIFENIIQKVQFPLIQSDTEMKPISWRNLPDNINSESGASRFQKTMDHQNNPIPLIYNNPDTDETIIFGYLHFGDSRLINRLIWLPYLQIGLVGLFILLGFVSFSVIRNSEKRHIWAGMARETAHQLGTPVSALLGWIDLLKNNPNRSKSIVKDMDIDLARLQEISNRFGDMGTIPKFNKLDLVELIQSVINYLQRRVPDADIRLVFDESAQYSINGNKNLLSWAIENLVKNGIDSSKDVAGKIDIILKTEDDQFVIDIIDFGVGIPKRDWKNIFRPGFSTKKYGWGLGLSLTKRIISDFHKGKIFVKESIIGSGTTIRILIG
ncbi:HAMP domain-containing histidine kinase [bacterium]|nr:HAMP domain-containing histidine kinase [bacterium]